ncbi:MAG: alanine racemase [Burkholderiales bacterium]|nr:alanine racemase [Burkholderiales bacterium]
MPRPIRASFDLGALRSNLAVVRAHAPRARVWGVVKANAYGHGLERAVGALAGADGYALLDLDDAVRVRDAGVRKPILLLEGFFAPDDLPTIAEHGLAVAVHNDEQLRMLESAGLPSRVPVYVKLNSGMNRLGFAPAAFAEAVRRLQASRMVGEIALMTHFADADGERGVGEQMACFEAAAGGFALPRSLANSAAVLRYPQTHAEWVRPGIMLYGCSPFPQSGADAFGLVPVMTLASELIAVRELARGDRVGYGGAFAAPKRMRIGVVACGYADGYPRHAPTGTPVLVAGKRTRIVGRVSMDTLTVDLAPVPEASVGTPVTLWGAGLSADEVAAAAGTLSYELLCGLTPRVPQVELE